MRIGIPILQNRIAPRSTHADSFVLLVVKGGRIIRLETLDLQISNQYDLVQILEEYQVETLICGANSSDAKELLSTFQISVVDNVACSLKDAIQALEKGMIGPGYGFSQNVNLTTGNESKFSAEKFAVENRFSVDCLACQTRECFRNEACHLSAPRINNTVDPDLPTMMKTATDMRLETETISCRMAELVYFILKMNYRKIGIAFCIDLIQQTTVLAAVLRRFTEVCCVCCRIKNASENDHQTMQSKTSGSSNPLGQADVLNEFESELNILVGLNIGMDCIFTNASKAPVTTLFVKDRMLANNPIGAIYSDFCLSEIAKQADLHGMKSTPQKRLFTSETKRRKAL
jgi:uncharacterized metal-binding protein/predicted Fe-Mo cluster-binding NifX family protein